MGSSLPQKQIPALSILICLLAFVPAWAFAEDFDGGGFFGSDTGSFFGEDTGITFGEDTGSFFGEDVGISFAESGFDTGFSFGEDTGITFGEDTGSFFGEDIGSTFEEVSITFEESGADAGFSFFSFGGDTFVDTVAPGRDRGGFFSGAAAILFSADAGGAAPPDVGGISVFEPIPFFSTPVETFSVFPAEFTGSTPPPVSGTDIIIAESPFEPPTPASEPFFAGAKPTPFIFAGSEPLGIVTVSQPIQLAVFSPRSTIALSDIPYTGIGSTVQSLLFILALLGVCGIAAHCTVRAAATRRRVRTGHFNSITPPALKAIRPVFASW